jgi:pimeloyl-ACP methyl ester carboxylesterase
MRKAGIACMLCISFLSCSSGGSPSQSNEKFARIERAFGASFCEPEKRKMRTTFDRHSNLDVLAQPDKCVQWDSLFGDIDAVSGTIKNGDDFTQLIAYVKNDEENGKSSRLSEKVIIRVPGGPHSRLMPSSFDYAYTSLLDGDDAFVALANAADAQISSYPEEGVSGSAATLRSVLQGVRSSFPDAKIVVVAESLGAVIAVEALGKMRMHNTRLILINPMFPSVNEAVRKLTLLNHPMFQAGKEAVFATRDSSGRLSLQRVSHGELLVSFIESRERDVDLRDRLLALPADYRAELGIVIVRGKYDELSTVGDLERIRAIGDVRTVEIENARHRFDRNSTNLLFIKLRNLIE